jgi:hypothetical protein
MKCEGGGSQWALGSEKCLIVKQLQTSGHYSRWIGFTTQGNWLAHSPVTHHQKSRYSVGIRKWLKGTSAWDGFHPVYRAQSRFKRVCFYFGNAVNCSLWAFFIFLIFFMIVFDFYSWHIPNMLYKWNYDQFRLICFLLKISTFLNP